VAAGLLRARLRNAVVGGLDRFAATYYSEAWDGFVALPADDAELVPVSMDGVISGAPSTPRACLDVQLEELPSLTSRALQSLRVDLPEGFFGIGIHRGKTQTNHGLLWRSAYQLGASFTFTVGARYEPRLDGLSDRYRCAASCPSWSFADFGDFVQHAPFSAPVIAVEMGGVPLDSFQHPDRCVYLLGSEDAGLDASALQACHAVVSLPHMRAPSYNVAVAGSILLYDRFAKERAAQLRRQELGSKPSSTARATAKD